MGIFGREYLKEMVKPNIMIENGSYSIYNETVEAYDKMIDILDEMCDEDGNTYINETAIEEIKDDWNYFINSIKNGKISSYKKCVADAKEAEEYLKEINDFLSDGNNVWSKEFELKEYYTYTTTVGDVQTTTYVYRDPVFSNTVINFDKMLQTIREIAKSSNKRAGFKPIYKELKKKVNDILIWKPTVSQRLIKASPKKAATMLSEKIKNTKKESENFDKSVDQMIKALDNGSSIIKSISKDEENAKFVIGALKKILKMQKSLYTHDVDLAFTNNRMIIQQSRYLRDFIKKHKNK